MQGADRAEQAQARGGDYAMVAGISNLSELRLHPIGWFFFLLRSRDLNLAGVRQGRASKNDCVSFLRSEGAKARRTVERVYRATQGDYATRVGAEPFKSLLHRQILPQEENPLTRQRSCDIINRITTADGAGYARFVCWDMCLQEKGDLLWISFGNI